jgi:NTP pyrophosphatase (non-canonical NTP hydrolase)
MSKEIHKKVLSKYFEQLRAGKKTFELRLADWRCNEGDILILEEIDDTTKQPTGRTMRRTVSYILKTKGVDLFPKEDVENYGYQILGLQSETLNEMQYRALVIANHYDDYNRKVGRKGWEMDDYMEGLVGDVGDLMKAVMAVRDRCDMENPSETVEHELNDILWSLLLLYKFFHLDPLQSFEKSMDELENKVIKMKQEAA